MKTKPTKAANAAAPTKAAKAAAATNTALAILFFGAAMVRPALAQVAAVNDTATKSVGTTLRYVGGDTRVGVGFDSELNGRAEIFQVLQSAADSATLAEAWAARHAGGLKLSRNWLGSETSVNKVFIAADQGENSVRKLTLGGGQEYQNWYWTTYLSKGLTGARLTDSATAVATRTITGADAGRPFEQDVTTTTVTNVFQRPFEWGVGARIGHFYEAKLLRLTAGLDYDTGKFSNHQTTASLVGEKFFEGSGISLALSVEVNRRNGQFVTDRSDTRGMATLRYEFGAPPSNFRPSRITRTVMSTERVPDPSWKAPEVITATQTEPSKAGEANSQTTLLNAVPAAKEAQETYFDLGGSKLKPKAFKELDELMTRVERAKPYASIKVDVTGHTCPTGSDRNNFPLSQRRADAVKRYLVSKGIAADVITTVGKAGKGDSKYPEGKGLGFRHRRADTEVVISKAVPNLPANAGAPSIPAPSLNLAKTPATAPMIDRQVAREVIEDAPNPWRDRALRNSVPHKTSVDVYRFTQTSATDTSGTRRFLNRAPTAVNDNVTAACGAVTTFNVLANDTDPEGDALTITGVSNPGKGSAVISSNKIAYTPNPASCSPGADTFTYTISDGKGGSSTATVNVALQAPAANEPPIAVDDSFTVACGASATLNVLANDRDPNGDPLRIISITSPQQGSRISIATDGKSLLLVPAILCFNTDSFTYTISDGRGGVATAKVTLIDP